MRESDRDRDRQIKNFLFQHKLGFFGHDGRQTNGTTRLDRCTGVCTRVDAGEKGGRCGGGCTGGAFVLLKTQSFRAARKIHKVTYNDDRDNSESQKVVVFLPQLDSFLFPSAMGAGAFAGVGRCSRSHNSGGGGGGGGGGR
jgi:hypothetical protein